MRKIYDYLLRITLALVAVFATVGCDPAENENPDNKKPAAPAIDKIEAGSITQTSASLSVTYKDAEKIFTTYYSESAVPADEDKLWVEKSVSEKDGACDIALSDLKIAKKYVFEAYAVNGDVKSTVKSCNFSTLDIDAATISIKAEVNAEVVNQIDVVASVTKAISFQYRCYEAESDADSDAKWTTVMVDKDGDYEFSISDLAVSAERDIIYVVEAVAVNSADALGEVAYAQVEVAQSQPALSYKVTPSSFALTVDVDINEEICDGYICIAGENEYIAEAAVNIESYIGFGFMRVCTADSVVICSDNFVPDAEYSLLIARVTPTGVDAETEQTTYEVVGDVITEKYNTSAMNYGVADLACKVELSNIMPGSVDMTIIRDEAKKSKLAYYGIVPAADVADGVEKYLSDNNWYGSSDASKEMFVADYLGESVVQDEILRTISSLSPSTDYVCFVIPIDSEYNPGNIIEQPFRTADIVVDPSIKHTVTNIETSLLASTASIEADVNFFGKCTRVYFYLHNGDPITDEEAEAKIMQLALGQYPPHWNISEAQGGVYKYQNDWLKTATDYVLYTIGGTEDGGFGEMVKTEFRSPGLSFSSSATIIPTFVSKVAGTYGPKTTFDIEMTNGCVKYKCGGVKSEEIEDPTSPTQCAAALLGTSGIPPSPKTATTVEVPLYSTQDIYVFIPMDANNEYGTPVIFNVSDL